MKIKDVIQIVDKLIPNEFDYVDKIRWLNAVERDIYDNVVSTHLRDVKETVIIDTFARDVINFTNNTPPETELLAPDRYSEMYVRFLVANIYLSREEVVKYNNAMGIYNTLMQRFRAWYNTTHMPEKGKKIKNYVGW